MCYAIIKYELFVIGILTYFLLLLSRYTLFLIIVVGDIIVIENIY